ncbi:MAG: hypothetical protein P8Y95_09125 [Gammaproteobacteria bacterium]
MYERTNFRGLVVEEDVIDDTRYRVIFLRDTKRGIRKAEIRARLRRVFNLTPEGVDRMFATDSIIVKENVDAQVAYRYKRAIDGTGASSRIEVMPRLQAVVRPRQKRPLPAAAVPARPSVRRNVRRK